MKPLYKRLVARILSVAVLLIVLGISRLSNGIQANAAQTPLPNSGITEVTVIIDNVTVTVHTPYMPDPEFTASGEVATSSRTQPLGMLQVFAVPFRTRPPAYSDPADPLPMAGPGLAGAYRTNIRNAWLNDGGDTQSGPTAILFGEMVTGDTYLVERVGTGSVGKKPVLVVEWITEAGPRLWIVSIQQGQPEGTKGLIALQPFLESLEQLEITSDTLNNPAELTPYVGIPQAGEGWPAGNLLFSVLLLLIASLLIFGGVVLRRT